MKSTMKIKIRKRMKSKSKIPSAKVLLS